MSRTQYAPAGNHFRDQRGILWKMSDFCGQFVRVVVDWRLAPRHT